MKDGADVERLAYIATQLARVLRTIEAHESWGAVFTIATLHGMPYKGPNWKDELAALEAELATWPEPEPDTLSS